MTTTCFAQVLGCTAALLFFSGCGGETALLVGDGGAGGASSSGGSTGSSGASSGGSSSSSGGFGSSSSSSTSSSSSGGGSSSSSSSSGGFGSSSSSGGSGSSSGASGSSSSSSGGSTSGPGTGTVYFEQCTGGGSFCESATFDFFAAFGPDSSGNQGCTVTTSGACSAYECTGGQSTPPGVSAGVLAISGGSIPKGVTVSPDSSNNYEYEDTGTIFAAGLALTVSASGGTVPAFGPVSVVAPPFLPLLSPVGDAGTYTISTSADLDVAWSGSTSGSQVIFEGAINDGSRYFTCLWDASAGKAVVPQSMLAPLANEGSAYILYGEYTQTSVQAGAYSVTVAALPYSGGTADFQ
jgi:hypothetical protein